GEPVSAPDRAAVEDPDRDQVEEVEEEARVGERVEERRAGVRADPPAGQRGERARRRPGERQVGVVQRVQRRVLDRHVGAQERDEARDRDVESLPLRLDEMTELVDEDQRHEADTELPAPDQRVRADRDEEAEELEDEEAELDDQADYDRDRPPDLPRHALPARLRVDRLVVAEIRLELGPGRELAHRLIVAAEELVTRFRPVPETESPATPSGTCIYRKDGSDD